MQSNKRYEGACRMYMTLQMLQGMARPHRDRCADEAVACVII